MFERQVLVLSPLHVTDIGSEDAAEDRSPDSTHQGDGENSSDGQTGNRRQRYGDPAQQADRRTDRRAHTDVSEEAAVGVALEDRVLPESQRNTQLFATETSSDQVSDGTFSSVLAGEDRSDVIVS